MAIMVRRITLLGLIAWLLCGAALDAEAIPTPIYRCDPPAGGPTLFSQFPCAGAAETVHVEPVQTFATAPLRKAGEDRLENLDRERRRQAASDSRDARRAAPELRQQELKRQQRCEAARDALQELATQRRKGYRLAEAPKLERRETELLAMRTVNC
jgi:hypothetical protein